MAQEVVIRQLRLPWPSGPRSADPIPEACAEVRGATVLLWYGDRARPALELDAIQLIDLRTSK